MWSSKYRARTTWVNCIGLYHVWALMSTGRERVTNPFFFSSARFAHARATVSMHKWHLYFTDHGSLSDLRSDQVGDRAQYMQRRVATTCALHPHLHVQWNSSWHGTWNSLHVQWNSSQLCDIAPDNLSLSCFIHSNTLFETHALDVCCGEPSSVQLLALPSVSPARGGWVVAVGGHGSEGRHTYTILSYSMLYYIILHNMNNLVTRCSPEAGRLVIPPNSAMTADAFRVAPLPTYT